MQKPDPSRITPIPQTNITDANLVQELTAENLKLRHIIEEMAQRLAVQAELIQQLRDEIAILKGQKPRPKFSPSKLEGQDGKPGWRKRIGPYNNQGWTT